MLRQRRGFSSLAEKLRDAAVAGDSRRSGAAVAQSYSRREDAVDSKGEPYRELFVMPKRKLTAQMGIERVTGRMQREVKSRMDLHDRLAVRRPREKEMREDQDWPSVWPAARSFAASVVPLPMRMGSRRYPEKRAPFKKQGNLELIKIPNFLHLTPAAIERHCEAIKKFCTPFPPEFASNPEGAQAAVPITIKYADYVHQSNNIRDNRARVVTIQLKLASLKLTEDAHKKMQRLAGSRYEEATDTLTITCDRCYTRAQNWDYAHYLLTVLYHEANKLEAWEELAERADALKLEFDGSSCKTKLVEMLGKTTNTDASSIEKQPEIKEFGEMWRKYMNTEETPEGTREYAARIKALLRSGSVPPTPSAAQSQQ